MGQSFVLGEIKAEIPLQNENSSNHQILWQQYMERIKSLSQESKVSRHCKEAGFVRIVEVGQYLVTKDTGNLRQFRSIACREYTLPRDDPSSQAKGWIQGNMRIGPVLEVTTSFRHFKYGIEIRVWSVNQDNSQSWVRISYGTIKHVVESIQDNTEVPADPQEERVPQTNVTIVAARSKAKAKPQPRTLVGTTATIPMHERRWIDIEPSKQDLASYDLSKKVVNLLRHNQKLHREEDGAIQFYKIKFHLRDHHSQIQNWSDDRWKACLAAGGGSKRRYQYCSDDSGQILYLRALQGHSGNNLIDPTLQDNVLIGTGIFHYIYHIGCAFNLHSIINNGLVPGGQNLRRRQTVFFLPVDPRDESHRDPEHIDFSVPRQARYVHSAWKRHQDAVFWVDSNLAIREGLTFYQTRSNAIILQGTFPAHCIQKVERLKTGLDNEKECLSNANLVSLCAKRFGKGQLSFIGPGSEKKWYNISEDSPQGEWDHMAERMLVELAESGWPGGWGLQGMATTGGGGLARVPNLRVCDHLCIAGDDNTRRKRTPSLPSHEPVVQRSAKKQRRWKIVDPLCSRFGNDYNCFSHNYFCKSAQSLRCSRRNV